MNKIKIKSRNYLKFHKSRMITKCTAMEYFLFEFSRKNLREISGYVTEQRREELSKTIGDSTKSITMFSSKRLFNERFSEFLGRKWLDPHKVPFDEFSLFVNTSKRVIVKPDDLLQGIGIYIYDISDNNEKSLNELYESCRKDNCIIEEVIKQHPVMHQMNHGSVNTVRVSTLYMNGVVHMISAALRIGDGSSCTDNFHNNGYGCAVNLENGAVISDGYNNKLQILPKHPISGIIFRDIKIPMWDKIIELTNDAAIRAGMYPQCKWLAWDVAITNEPILIEGNWGQGCDIIQIGQSGKYELIQKIIDNR